MYHAFPPIIADEPRILILGTFPSPMSREKGEYYGNPQNKFWKIIFDIFGARFDNPDYDEKKRVLVSNGLALWDVIRSCEIIGALDSNIRNPVYNTELPALIRAHAIPCVVFNGKKAYDFYSRGIGSAEKIILPSTSPANARYSYAQKLAAWSQALKP
jgi:hypoxanthine-DNA glycosylase